jgi:hypothetical protein
MRRSPYQFPAISPEPESASCFAPFDRHSLDDLSILCAAASHCQRAQPGDVHYRILRVPR